MALTQFRIIPLSISLALSPVVVASDIETIAVYGDFIPMAINTMPSPVFVLSAEQIAPISGSTALDILAQVPGITIKKSGGVQDIYLRGAESNFVIIQIDGVQVNNPLDSRGGSFDLASLSKEQVVRVEVIKGAQSSMFGSDAIAGVINFITYDREFEGANVALGSMPKGQKVAAIQLGMNQVGVTANLLDTDKQNNGDSQRLAEFAVNGEFALSNNSQTKLNTRYSDYQQFSFPDQSGGDQFALDNTKDAKESQLVSASIRHQLDFSSFYQLAIQSEYMNTKDTLMSPGIKPYFNAPPAFTDNDYSHYKIRWLNALNLGDLATTIGVDYKSEKGETTGYLHLFGSQIPTEYQAERDNFASFIDLRFDQPAYSLFASVRHDSPEHWQTETTWKLGASVPLSPHWRLFANIGDAYKLPSLYALSNNMIGNPDLQPEQAESTDLGVEWQGEGAEFNVSLFNYHYQQLIDFDAELFSLVNRANIQTTGAEFISSVQLNEQLAIGANITYADVDIAEGELLTGRPTWQGGANVSFQAASNVTVNGLINYVGHSTSTTLYTGDFSVVTLASYIKLDLNTHWVINDQQTIDFYVTNALDKSYQYAVGFSAPELGFGGKFSWRI